MSWLDDVIKKIADSGQVITQSDNIAKATERLSTHQNNLAAATADIVSKERPNIERGIGQDVLAQAVRQQQPTPTSTMGPGLQDAITGQQTQAPSTIYGGPGSEYASGFGSGKGRLAETVAAQPNFISRLPAEAGKFMQSVGYGMLDKPLGREASTWDYLGKTVGQIARLNEGSGLGAGQQIYNDTTVQYQGLQNDLAKIPDTVIADPNAKMATYRELLRKYPKLQSFLSEYFGLTRSYDYNYPQGPAPKFNLGNPTGAPAGAE